MLREREATVVDAAMSEPDQNEEHRGRFRLRAFWVASALGTVVFLLFVYLMMMVPGVPAAQKIWMLSIAGGLLVVPLGIGIWKFGTSDAPIMARPLGPVVWVLLLLELGVCVLGIFQVIAAPYR
jgi:hypothetical protein